MKTYQKLSLYLLAAALLALAGYTVSTFTGISLTNCAFADSTDNSGSYIVRPSDLGNMYNERGFMKSNSAGIDEKEIINDFNGNLMYSIPIAKGKGQGDLAYEVSLNYNGNVNHMVITSDLTGTGQLSGQLHQYNVTSPEWIVSFNGLAVQTLNFESYFFTKPDANNEAKGKDVKLLAPGYQLTDMLNTSNQGVNDRITIMLGDGSTETLENTSTGVYDGIYITKNKNSYLKARVFNGGNSAGNLRVMYLMKGDGLTYIYRESDIKYQDYSKDGNDPWFWPQIFLLTDVYDRFGHSYNLTYNSTGIKGRPFLTECPGVMFTYPLVWNTYTGIAATTDDGMFKFYTEQFGLEADNVRRPQLLKIVNPTGQTMQFGYESYKRTGLHLYKDGNNIQALNIIIGGNDNQYLHRLSHVTNYNGGTRDYTYQNGADLTLDYVPGVNQPGAHSTLSNYMGQGRDYFFSNMVNGVTVKDGTAIIKSESFTYAYNHTRDENNIWTYPVDTTDDYVTTRMLSSAGTSNNYETPTTEKSIKTYKNYPLMTQNSGERTDFDGTIQLVKDLQYAGNPDTLFKTTTTSYYISNGNGNSAHDLLNGTFLPKQTTEVFNESGASRTWSCSYQGGGNDPLSQKSETDPLGRTTITNFTDFNIEDYRIFQYGSYHVGQGQVYSRAYIYLIQQPTDITIEKGSTILQKKVFEYCNPDSVTGVTPAAGYPGQLHIEKDINPTGSNVLRQVTYLYSNQDTTSKCLYTPPVTNVLEGNLKQVTDADGGITKYYYALLSRGEDILYTNGSGGDEFSNSPRLTYHMMLDNGNDSLIRTGWTDNRLPSRIDSYINGTSFLTTYQLYDNIGNPAEIINNNNCLSTADYGQYNRISKITLPYDFSSLAPDTVLVIDTTRIPITLTTASTSWGYKDDLAANYCNGDNMTLTPYVNNLIPYNSFFIYVKNSGSGTDPNEIRKPAIALFSNNNFPNIQQIDSAFVEIAPFSVNALVNGNTTTDYSVVVKPLSSLHTENFICNNDWGYRITTGSGYSSIGGLNFTTSNTCPNSTQDIMAVYGNNRRRLNITDMLQQNISYASGLSLEGLAFYLAPPGNISPPSVDMLMTFTHCPWTDTAGWKASYEPKLTIYGSNIKIDTTRILKYRNGTIVYFYDDAHNKVSVFSKLDKSGSANRFKRAENLFDGFGRVKLARSYNDDTHYDSSQVFYNYLGAKSKTIDANANEVKLSYNQWGTQFKTQNADNSHTLVSEGFWTSLTTSLAAYGFAHKQIFTDETGRNFDKYFDAAGNLIREVKYVSGDGSGGTQGGDNPFNPDTIISGDTPPADIPLITDYQYDDLNRVILVKTPEGKTITYTYDLLGRVSSRTTADAGFVRFGYDKNNNLLLSQDANQRAIAANLYTARNYDGANRLLTIGDRKVGVILNGTGNGAFGGDTTLPDVLDSPIAADSLYTINCYDTLSLSPVSGFFDSYIPSGYTSSINRTKGALVAAAFRTNIGDNWSTKFYRYDARGRVVKMWEKLAGMDSIKIIEYNYNSQNQVTNVYYENGHSDWKFFRYNYDNAGRLQNAGLLNYIPIGGGTGNDNPAPPNDTILTDGSGNWMFAPYAAYTYNPNQQISTYSFNNGGRTYNYTYNNRNWLTLFNKTGGSAEFVYTLAYDSNGNIRNSAAGGTYQANMQSPPSIYLSYIYDKSNRLVKAARSGDSVFTLINNYDRDGNITRLKRYGSSNNLKDDYTYTYNSGTNKLNSVTGSVQQYSYDYNGNVTGDSLNHLFSFVYDYRNLLTEFRIWKPQMSHNRPTGNIETYKTDYQYDEGGNRICKTIYKWSAATPQPLINETDSPGSWNLQSTEYYIRDVSGKELAIYSGNSIEQWNMFAADNVGKIDANNFRYFYLKDHLGTVRAILDTTNTVIAANDYDAWGYPLENRSYNLNNIPQKYQFTGKERDIESGIDGINGYDYFGARYYNNRVANWTSIDPLFEKHVGWTPYNYVLGNPIVLIDPNGKQNRSYMLAGDSPQEGWKPVITVNNPAMEEAHQPIQSFIPVESEGTKTENPFLALCSLSWEIKIVANIIQELGKDKKPVISNYTLRKIDDPTRNVTIEDVESALATGERYTGHDSGYLTIIKQTEDGSKNIVLGLDPVDNTTVTIYKTSRSLSKLISKMKLKPYDTFKKIKNGF